MFKRLIKDKSGFTLVEMLITLAITTIIMSTLTSMMVYAYKSYHQADLVSTRMNGINNLTETIRKYTYNANEITITSALDAEQTLNDPQRAKDCTFIYCVDNDTVYVNGNPVENKTNLRLSALRVDFVKDDTNMLKLVITANDENAQSVLAEKESYIYLANCEKIKEKTELGSDAIIIKNLNVELEGEEHS